MKKIITACWMLCGASSFLFSQNLQLHYDFRHSLDDENPVERNFLVGTFEMYHPDKYGNTFLFVDFDFSGDKGNLYSIYTEISREFQIKDFPVLPHIEFNGGVGFGYTITNAYMVGAAYPFSIGKFEFNPYLVYRYNNFETASHDAQLSIVWNGSLWKEKLSISGCVDFWTEDKQGEDESGKKLIIYSEPQFWYNFNKHFSVGTELKVSWNFEWFTTKVKIYPTLGVKYTF